MFLLPWRQISDGLYWRLMQVSRQVSLRQCRSCMGKTVSQYRNDRQIYPWQLTAYGIEFHLLVAVYALAVSFVKLPTLRSFTKSHLLQVRSPCCGQLLRDLFLGKSRQPFPFVREGTAWKGVHSGWFSGLTNKKDPSREGEGYNLICHCSEYVWIL